MVRTEQATRETHRSYGVGIMKGCYSVVKHMLCMQTVLSALVKRFSNVKNLSLRLWRASARLQWTIGPTPQKAAL